MSIFTDQQERALQKARAKHPAIHSIHEGYAVILEELEEVWDICRAVQHATVPVDTEYQDELRKELLHVAAMCQRMAEDLEVI